VELSADVVIVGAGPAGACVAQALAPTCRVLLFDRADPARPPAERIGESLPAAARRIFRDLGLWEDFQRQGHLPCYGGWARWGGPQAVTADSIADPDGHGWRLDRARFDAWMRAWAERRGAAVVAPARLAGVASDGDGWRLALVRNGRPLSIAARSVVDAGGRAAPLARALGQRRRRAGRLVCRWLAGPAADAPSTTVIEAEPDGWWYTAALPGGRRVLAFHTDADLPSAGAGREALLGRASANPVVGPLLRQVGFDPAGAAQACAAHTSWIDAAAGPGWLAVGDAALTCDPLSSQGLYNALYSGFLAAGALREALDGRAGALGEYAQAMARVGQAYRSHLAAWYALETRWPEAPFWARRRGPPAPAAGDRHAMRV
jgi:flavin-dependent dehydrogenase